MQRCGFVQKQAGNLHSPVGKYCYTNTFLNRNLVFEGPKRLNYVSVFTLSTIRKKNAEASIFQ